MPVITPQQLDSGSGDEAATPATIASPTAAPRRDAAHGDATQTPNAIAPRRRRRWPWVAVAGVAVAATATGIAVSSADDDAGDGDASGTEPRQVQTAEVEQRDLAEFEEVTGTMSYGDATEVAAGRDGTVTAIVAAGATIERGTVLAEIDSEPTVVLWGELPLYRTLRDGVDDGADVRVLEANLAALGYDADGDLVIDDEFDDATIDAVQAWQDDLGVDDDGVVEPSDVTVLAGPAVVDELAVEVGSAVSATTPVLSVSVTDTVTTVFSPAAGRLTAVPSVGDGFTTGDVAYEVDTDPVPVIVGDVAFERRLVNGVTAGDDVEQLEQALTELGYDADGELEVDDEYDTATALATADWFDDLGLEPGYGEIDEGRVAVVPEGARVLTVEADRGDAVEAGDPILTVGVSQREITGVIDSGDVDLIAVGDGVGVEFPDGSLVEGTITAIDPSSTADPATGEATTEFTVAVSEVPESAAGRYQVDVTIDITRQLVEGATVVPSSALVSVGDGTYAVEVVDGGTTRFVAVEPGLFADGYVEVTGVEAGAQVVVPS